MNGLPRRARATFKTYSHLAGERRIPSEYEIVSSKLLPYVARGGFETDLPLGAWYARYQQGSRLRSTNWERFSDPRATTYTKYVGLERDREGYVDGLFASMEDPAYARGLSPGWSDCVAASLFPLRFALHGLQMTAAYVGQMAPCGRIVIACLLQAADETRRIQRIAYRMAVARRERPAVESDARLAWQVRPEWQPLRRAIEQLLVTWDWGESFAALNLAVKPWLDALVNVTLARRARASGDSLLAEMLRSLGEDASWHRAWSHALLAVADGDESDGAIRAWTAAWGPTAEQAVRALAPVFGVDEAELAADARAQVAEALSPGGPP